jgi:hypothetical protein
MNNVTNAQVVADYQRLQEEYAEYAGEAQAEGHEVMTFAEWSGTAPDPKQAALEVEQARWDDDTHDLY